MFKHLTGIFSLAALATALTLQPALADPPAPKSPPFSTNPVFPDNRDKLHLERLVLIEGRVALEDGKAIKQTEGDSLNLEQAAPREISRQDAKFEKTKDGFSVTVELQAHKPSGGYHLKLAVYDFNGAAENKNVPVIHQEALGTPKTSFFEEGGKPKMKIEYNDIPSIFLKDLETAQAIAVIPTPVGPLIHPPRQP